MNVIVGTAGGVAAVSGASGVAAGGIALAAGVIVGTASGAALVPSASVPVSTQLGATH